MKTFCLIHKQILVIALEEWREHKVSCCSYNSEKYLQAVCWFFVFFSRIIACMKNIARNLSEIWTMFIFFYIFVWICMIFFFSVIKQFISSLQPCHLLYSFPVCIGNCLQNVISVETCRHDAERIIIHFLKWSTGCLIFFAFYLDSCILYFEWMWI